MDHELYRRDATRNMARFYGLTVVPGLFGQTGLCRTWGRIGARGGRSIVEWFATPVVEGVRAHELLHPRPIWGAVPLSLRERTIGAVVLLTGPAIALVGCVAASMRA